MPTALLSVYDKTGLVDLARSLHENGWNLLASGGTASLLQASQIPVTQVADYTGSPEILGGRVKTLHPAIHGGLLARSNPDDLSQLRNLGWDTIDLVVVNLYPFEQTAASPGASEVEIIENIDIGGVALIRAAAKNYERVILLSDPSDYKSILSSIHAGGVNQERRKQLAAKGFAITAHYDAAIAAYYAGQETFQITGHLIQSLRYGENPHQPAALYAFQPGAGPLGGQMLQGKELSYNNLLDLDAAWRAASSFERPTICIVKHLSPCGIASSDSLANAYTAAFASDPVSAFGGVIASNRPLDGETAGQIADLFVECIIAPGFLPDALELLARKKNCRLVSMPTMHIEPAYEFRSITNGFVRQGIDFGDPPEAEWKVVSARQPTGEEWVALRFAWKACQHVKSNAIVLGQGESTVGIGGGQPNRVDCVRIAALRAGELARGSVMASDAFFPFADSVEAAAQAGVTAVIQPGGSVRDAESIAAADAAGMAMVLTGVRHFRH